MQRKPTSNNAASAADDGKAAADQKRPAQPCIHTQATIISVQALLAREAKQLAIQHPNRGHLLSHTRVTAIGHGAATGELTVTDQMDPAFMVTFVANARLDAVMLVMAIPLLNLGAAVAIQPAMQKDIDVKHQPVDAKALQQANPRVIATMFMIHASVTRTPALPQPVQPAAAAEPAKPNSRGPK